MDFVAPTAAAWAALVLPIVALYILKVRLRRVPVSTTIFWSQVFDQQKPRAIWQRLRHLVSLLVQILLLLLLVLALMQPFFPWEVQQSQRIVLVLDNSASMQATDVLPSRLAAAKEAGFELISRLRTRDEMAILAAGAQPRVVCGLTGHQRTLRHSLDEVAAADGTSQMAQAVELARRLIGDHPRGEIVVLTDGCFAETAVGQASRLPIPAESQAGSLRHSQAGSLRHVLVGRRTENLGITQFQVRRSLADPLGYEVLVEVLNASDDPAECRLELDFADRPVDVVPLKLTPGEVWRRTFEKTTAAGGLLQCRLNRHDALDVDNRAVAILTPRNRQPVLLVGGGNRFVQEALLANSLVDLTVADTLPAAHDSNGVVVFHRQTPPVLPPGDILIVDPANATDLWTLGDPLDHPIVTDQAVDSPLMRHVRLDNVLMPQARQLRLLQPAQILAGSLGGDPLYAALERPTGKVLVLTVNLDEGDLPLRTAFPILVTNALAWFAGGGAELHEAQQAGAMVDIELPTDGGDEYVLTSPDGRQHALPAGVKKTTVGPLDQCGVWTVRTAAGSGVVFGEPANHLETGSAENDSRPLPASPVLQIACNLADRNESDLRPPPGFLEQQATLDVKGSWLPYPLWFYLVAAAWLLSAVEWFLYQRRWIS